MVLVCFLVLAKANNSRPPRNNEMSDALNDLEALYKYSSFPRYGKRNGYYSNDDLRNKIAEQNELNNYWSRFTYPPVREN